MNGEKFLADAQNNLLHNLDKEKKECCINNVISSRNELPFKTIENALLHKDYKFCKYCFVKIELEYFPDSKVR